LKHLFPILLFLLFITSCSKKIHDTSIISKGETITFSASAKDTFEWINTGTAGVIARYKNTAILIDPFISNPSLKKVAFGKILPDTTLVEKVYSNEILEQTKAVFVGHGHYDHILELPAIAARLNPDATVFCSNSTKNLLAPTSLKQIVDAEQFAVNYNQEGTWLYSSDSSVRAMSFLGTHPPHFLGITLYKGNEKKPLNELPDKAKEWKLGTSLTYLIDFLEKGKPVFRIFTQSSSCKDSVGLFPSSLLEEKKVDVSYSAAATSGSRIAYLQRTIDIVKPSVTVLTHWENFFKPFNPSVPEGIAKSDVSKLYKLLQESHGNKTKIILPQPDSKFFLVR
jgi:ribonuclease BN (tRNA processing enzyme)